MKAILFSLILLTIQSVAFADQITTRIEHIVAPEAGESFYLLLAETGEVFELDARKSEAIKAAYIALEVKSPLTLALEDSSFIKSMTTAERVAEVSLNSFVVEEEFFSEQGKVPTPLDNYEVSNLESYAQVEKLFKTQRTNTRRRSQCYNRAHVWTYEFSKKSIHSGKVWLFFTKKFIKEYHYKWWFHVAPYLNAQDQNEELVMDRSFTRKPTLLNDWKNIFIYNKAHCPTVEYYSHYRDYFWDGNEWCFFIKSSMFYWQPFNIEDLEKGKAEKKRWMEEELEQAYRNAIRGWNGDL